MSEENFYLVNVSTFHNESGTASPKTVQIINVEQIVVTSICFTLGLTAALAHLLLLLTVIASKKLHRKEIFILVGVSFGELLYGIGYLIVGPKRIYWFLHLMEKIPISVWDCQLQPFTFFFIFGAQVTALMNFYISVDRYIAVAFYQKYMTIKSKHVLIIISFVYACSLCSYFVGLGIAYSIPRNVTVPLQCLSTWSSSSEYVVFFTCIAATFEFLSAVVYVAVVFAMKQYSEQLSNQVKTAAKERQMRVTKTVTLTVIISFFFQIIPWGVIVFLNALKVNLGSASLLSPILWMSILINNVLMAIIYWTKLEDLRKAFIRLITKNSNQISPSSGATNKSSTPHS